VNAIVIISIAAAVQKDKLPNMKVAVVISVLLDVRDWFGVVWSGT
jgi:hypothetical protein